MKIYKLLILLFLSIFFESCDNSSGKVLNDFSIITNTTGKNHTISNNKTLELSVENPKKHQITAVDYTLNGKEITSKLNLAPLKLGRQTIKATVHYDGKTQVTSKTITILNSVSPKIYTIKVLNTYPHNTNSFTQGLEFDNDVLYEGTGQNKESKLIKVDYKTGKILDNINLADQYFGEGITILKDNIYQLTWKSHVGFVYNKTTFKKKSSFKYGASQEGWGLCNDGSVIYKSDGTEKIWLLDPKTLVEKSYIQAFTNKGKVDNINELEWIDGKIYANRWQKNGIAIINPNNGAIEGVINLNELAKKHEASGVINGIAYHPSKKTLFITGKKWDTLYEVELIAQKK